ncbi:MAG: threonylcarbamoyl-AMP synthase [PVC group bacterium]|nr:threonylcarbamoyl-AMP synthase [PVC group bacterium]
MSETKIIKINSERPEVEKIDEAVAILKGGGIIAFPTETVYGLAALVNDKNAVERLRQIKQRDDGKKFSMCVYNISQIEYFASEISPFAYRLMKKFWPGPLTLVLKSGDSETIGFRMPDHGVAQLLLRRVTTPVFAPSANPPGKKEPICADDVLAELDGAIDAVIDAGISKLGVASTVCAVEDNNYNILRQGAVSEDLIQEESKYKNVLFVCTGNSCRSAMAEGLMKKIVKDNKYIKVTSAGVAAFDGMSASAEAVMVMQQQGVDISEHRAHMLTDEMIRESDYILVMSQDHKRQVLYMDPSSENRVFLLKEFAAQDNGNLNIPDPIGMEIRFYEQVLEVLQESIERLVLKIK